MRIIPTFVHGIMDYAVALLLLASPWLFHFDHGSAETLIPIAMAGGVILYSTLTAYELGIVRLIPMPIHLLLDVAGGVLLAVSPWLFNFADVVTQPHLFIGLAEIVVAMFTKTQSTRSGAQPIIG